MVVITLKSSVDASIPVKVVSSSPYKICFLFKGHPGAIFNKIGHQKSPFGGAIGVVRVILTAYLRGPAFIFILVVELV